MKLERDPLETIDQYDRRRKRCACNCVVKICSWATLWAKRSVEWHDHLSRKSDTNDVLGLLFKWHNLTWLREQRSRFVNVNSRNAYTLQRNTIFAGNTGTRLLGVRPQPRFEEGVDLARQALKSDRKSLSSSNVLSLHSVLQQATTLIRGT